jgi:hypothetical protein
MKTAMLSVLTLIVVLLNPFAVHGQDITGSALLDLVIVGLVANGAYGVVNETDIGEMICRAGGGSFCSGSSLGEGICRAGGGSFCSGSSLGEGICRALGGSFCSGLTLDPHERSDPPQWGNAQSVRHDRTRLAEAQRLSREWLEAHPPGN